jgi:ABC-type transport system substrate-binding protein
VPPLVRCLSALAMVSVLAAVLAGCGASRRPAATPAEPAPSTATVASRGASVAAIGASTPVQAAATGTTIRAAASATEAVRASVNRVLVTRDDGLHLLDLNTGKETSLVSAPAGTYITYPAWSADGMRILFVGTNAPYELNADGSDLHTIGSGVMHGQIAWHQAP